MTRELYAQFAPMFCWHLLDQYFSLRICTTAASADDLMNTLMAGGEL